MGKSITLKFKSDTRSQASVTHLFDALLGRPPSPTCAKCGGITVNEGPSNGRCKCAKADSPNSQNRVGMELGAQYMVCRVGVVAR